MIFNDACQHHKLKPNSRSSLVAAAPGPVVADPATLPFTNLRPNLRLRPKANR